MLAGCYPRSRRGPNEQPRPLRKALEPGRTVGRGGFTESLPCSRDGYFYFFPFFFFFFFFYKQQNRTVFIKNTRRVSSHRHLAEPVRVPQVGGGWSCSLCLLAAAGFGPEQFSSGG